MATRDRHRYQCDPTETQLRVMLEARQHALEAHRQRTSRTFSIILVGVVFLVSGAIWLFPTAPSASGHAAALPATPGAAATDSTDDVRFAMQLLNFVNPAAPPASSAASAEARTAAEPAIQTATKASAAMP